VRWLQNENGLDFERLGSVASWGAFSASDSNRDHSRSLEIWLEPDVANDSHTILAFDGFGRPEPPFSLFQNWGSLGVRRHNVDEHGTDRIAVFEVAGVLRPKKRVFVSVTLGKHETSVYLDGVLAKTSQILGESKDNFSGRLVLGNSATVNDSWHGRILGLAMYQDLLTQTEIAKHYDQWTKAGEPRAEEKPLAVYLFDEGHGAVVRNRISPATDLLIPAHYFVLHPAFFSAPRNPYRFGRPSRTYWKDIILNVVGFVPAGFFFLAYLSSMQRLEWPATTAIIFGFVLSVAIETLQRFLPTRDSDMTDIITNTVGTAIGVVLYRGPWVQDALARAVQYGKKATPSCRTNLDLPKVYADVD
jgi:hypothetical protein